MRVETPAGACAALAVLIAGADEIGTMQEGRFMFETIAALPVFADLDRARFAALMAETTEWVWASFPAEGGRITDEATSGLVALICKSLPPESRLDVFRAAVGLARSDGISGQEEILLSRVCDELEIDRDAVRDLLDPGA